MARSAVIEGEAEVIVSNNPSDPLVALADTAALIAGGLSGLVKR